MCVALSLSLVILKVELTRTFWESSILDMLVLELPLQKLRLMVVLDYKLMCI